jgi:hypothetical protein
VAVESCRLGGSDSGVKSNYEGAHRICCFFHQEAWRTPARTPGFCWP